MSSDNRKFNLRGLMYILACIVCITALVLYMIYEVIGRTKKDYSDVIIDRENGYVESVITNSRGIKIDFNELRTNNENIYGYIDIPDTDIQSPVERNDYRAHTMMYTTSDNSKRFSERNVVVHADGAMYADLCDYRDEHYAEQHNVMKVSSLEADMVYKIFAVGYYGGKDIMNSYNFTSFSGLVSYIEDVKEHVIYYDDSVVLDNTSGIITLSTYIDGERLLILAVMVE